MLIQFIATTRLRLYSCLHESSSPTMKLFLGGDTATAASDPDSESFSYSGLTILYFPDLQGYAAVPAWSYEVLEECRPGCERECRRGPCPRRAVINAVRRRGTTRREVHRRGRAPESSSGTQSYRILPEAGRADD